MTKPPRTLFAVQALPGVPAGGADVPVVFEGRLVDPAQVFEGLIGDFYCVHRGRNTNEKNLAHNCRVIRRFRAFVGTYPWRWTKLDWSRYATSRLDDDGAAGSTVRSEQIVISQFMQLLTDPSEDYADFASRCFGRAPRQIVGEDNRITRAVVSGGVRRAAERAEIELLVGHLRSEMERIRTEGGKGYHALWRDMLIVLTAYAYGLRNAEVRHLDVSDFAPSPADPMRYGKFGSVFVRAGKAKRGGASRRRVAYLLPVFDFLPAQMAEYLDHCRPWFPESRSAPGALFVTDRGTRLTGTYLCRRIVRHRDAAGLPDDVTLHVLRHSAATHMQETGTPPHIVSHLLGHEHPASTAVYTHVDYDRIYSAMVAHHRRRAVGP